MGRHSPLRHLRSSRSSLRRGRVRLALLGVLASVGVVLVASVPSAAKPSIRDTGTDRLMATCRTDAAGICTVWHPLGVVPVGLQLAPRIPRNHEPYELSVVSGSETTERFRVLATRADGSPDAYDRIRFSYWVTGVPVAPSPTTTSTTSTTVTPTTTTPEPTETTSSTTPTATPTPTTTNTTRTSSPGETTGEKCTDPVHTWSTHDGGLPLSGAGVGDGKDYYGHPNVWNDNGKITATMGLCSFHSWYVDVAATGTGDGAVLAYPNTHKDWHDWGTGAEPRIDSFDRIPTKFAATGPTDGSWNLGYDAWLNGVAVPGSTEVMIWNRWRGERSMAGFADKVDTVTIGGRAWDVYTTTSSIDWHYVAFLAVDQFDAGSFDFKHFTDYMMANGLLRADSTLGAIDYGVEMVGSAGRTLHFDVTDFQVDAY